MDIIAHNHRKTSQKAIGVKIGILASLLFVHLLIFTTPHSLVGEIRDPVNSGDIEKNQ